MNYYLKRLGHQELGSVKNEKAQRGRYIYISKDDRVLDFFPPLSKTVTNDSSVIPIIPLYEKPAKKIYCNFIYHNDKFNVQGGTRNEYRLYSNKILENNRLLFQTDDILIFKAEKDSTFEASVSTKFMPESAVEESKIYFLYRCSDHNSKLYKKCNALIEESNIRGNGHAVYQGVFDEVENAIKFLLDRSLDEIDTVIDDTVTAKAQAGNVQAMARLFNPVSFRDFVMTGYEFKCAITGNVIRYGNYMNLEAAHICPKSHQGLYLPSNGIALSRDMHWAFDKGLFTIDNNLRVVVHPEVDSEYLRQYDKKQLFIPKNDFFKPDVNNLHYHQKNVYGLFKTAGSLVKAVGYYGSDQPVP